MYGHCCLFLVVLVAVSKMQNQAKSSMQDVNQCAEGLKDDNLSSKEKTEKIKETEAQNSTQGYQW